MKFHRFAHLNIAGFILATSGFTATEHLPASLSLKAATSPFELRMFAGIGPFYRYDIHSEGKVVFWDNYFHNSMDSDEGPNYVDEAFARQAIPRWEKYCKVVSDLGGNAIMLGDAIHLVTFDRLVPGDPFAIYPKDSLYRARHLYHRRYFTELIAIAKKYGLDFYVYTDEFMYTPPLGDWIGRISADNPRLWQAYQAQFDEMLTEMPEIAGVVVRLGELYPTKGYLARGIADSRGHDPTNYRKLIEKTWEVVCKKHKKTYVHRTWSLGHDSLTGQAYLYDRIWNGMPTEGVIVSVKHTQTDFWYYNPVNPCLGVGRHKQIIEVQTRREYHAMGVWPDCPWQDYQQAYRLMARLPQAAGYWLWPNEGGGPNGVDNRPQTHYSYLKGFAAWNEANTYLASALGHDPSVEPRAVLHKWAEATYGPDAADAITEILMLSPRTVFRGHYISDYAKDNVWWPLPHIRWFVLTRGGFDPYRPELLPGAVARMAMEGYEGHELALSQLKLFLGVKDKVADRQLAADTLDSLEHAEAFYRLMRDWRETALYYFQTRARAGEAAFNGGRVEGEARSYLRNYREARKRMESSLSEYDGKYRLYNTEQLHEGLRLMATGAWR